MPSINNRFKLHCVPKKWDSRNFECPVVSLLQLKLARDIGMNLAIKCINNLPPHLSYVSTHCRKPTRPKGVRNDAAARPPNLSSASCDLDLWPPNFKVVVSCPCPVDQLCQLASKSLSNIVLTSLVTERMDERSIWERYVSACQSDSGAVAKR